MFVPEWTTPRAASDPINEADVDQTQAIGLALIGVRADTGRDTPPVGYLLPFAAISVHLLVVLVGAAYLARTKVVGPPRPSDSMTEGRSHRLTRLILGAFIAVDIVKLTVFLALGTRIPLAASGLVSGPLSEELNRVCSTMMLGFVGILAIHSLSLAASLARQRIGLLGQFLALGGLVTLLLASSMPILGSLAGAVSLVVSAIVLGCLWRGGKDSLWAISC